MNKQERENEHVTFHNLACLRWERKRETESDREESVRVRGCHTFKSHLSVNSFIFHLQHTATALVMLTARRKSVFMLRK